MTLLYGSYTPVPAYTSSPDQGRHDQDELSSWITHKAAASESKLRAPAVFASARIGLSDQRCAELQDQIQTVRHKLLNPRPADPPDLERYLYDRLTKLETLLHQERLALWSNLLPLANVARDAGVEAMRQSWLREYADIVNAAGERVE
ncbi:MAG: hypothetical protein AAFZ67_08540 [Planctomycetota bacterium]